MNEQIMSLCNAKEINSIAENALYEIGKRDWSKDSFIPVIVSNLLEQNKALTLSIGTVRSSDFTHRLVELDDAFDKDFICFKQFVIANTYSTNKTRVEAANWIWKIIVAHNQFLYRTGYESQIASTGSLLMEFDRSETKPRVNSLIGVTECLEKLKVSAANLQALYRLDKEDEASKAKLISPSMQKNIVRDIINKDLLPYLNLASKSKPEIYKETADVIFTYVESINIKVRARKNRGSNPEVDKVLEKESNNLYHL